MHVAVESANVELVKLLVESGANCDLADESNGWTPLFCACNLEHPQLILEVLVGKSNLNHFSQEGETVFHVAASKNKVELLECLLKCAGSEYVNILNKKQQTPLILASNQGHLNIVNLLLAFDCDPTIYDSFGFQAFHEAISFHHLEVIS